MLWDLFRVATREGRETVNFVVKLSVTLIGAVTGTIAAFTSSSARTPSASEAANQPPPPRLKKLMAITGPVFVICLIMALSWALKGAIRDFGAALLGDRSNPFVLHFNQSIAKQCIPWYATVEFLLILVGLVVIGVLASRIVNVNRFSLHGMYRNRLGRGYLGASNQATGGGGPPGPGPVLGGLG